MMQASMALAKAQASPWQSPVALHWGANGSYLIEHGRARQQPEAFDRIIAIISARKYARSFHPKANKTRRRRAAQVPLGGLEEVDYDDELARRDYLLGQQPQLNQHPQRPAILANQYHKMIAANARQPPFGSKGVHNHHNHQIVGAADSTSTTQTTTTVNGLLALVVLFLIAICGTMGAIFIMSALTVIESLQTRGNCYLVSLAMSHLLVTLFVIPSSALQIMAGEQGLNSQALCHYQWLTLEFSLMVGHLSFALIALDNYLGYSCSEKVVVVNRVGGCVASSTNGEPSGAPGVNFALGRHHQQRQQQQQPPPPPEAVSGAANISSGGSRRSAMKSDSDGAPAASSDKSGQTAARAQLQEDFFQTNKSNQAQVTLAHKANLKPTTTVSAGLNTVKRRNRATLIDLALFGRIRSLLWNAKEESKQTFGAELSSELKNVEEKSKINAEMLPPEVRRKTIRAPTITTNGAQKPSRIAWRLAEQFAGDHSGASLKRPGGCLSYRACCGRLKVLLWILLTWCVSFAYVAHEHRSLNFGTTFCAHHSAVGATVSNSAVLVTVANAYQASQASRRAGGSSGGVVPPPSPQQRDGSPPAARLARGSTARQLIERQPHELAGASPPKPANPAGTSHPNASANVRSPARTPTVEPSEAEVADVASIQSGGGSARGMTRATWARRAAPSLEIRRQVVGNGDEEEEQEEGDDGVEGGSQTSSSARLREKPHYWPRHGVGAHYLSRTMGGTAATFTEARGRPRNDRQLSPSRRRRRQNAIFVARRDLSDHGKKGDANVAVHNNEKRAPHSDSCHRNRWPFGSDFAAESPQERKAACSENELSVQVKTSGPATETTSTISRGQTVDWRIQVSVAGSPTSVWRRGHSSLRAESKETERRPETNELEAKREQFVLQRSRAAGEPVRRPLPAAARSAWSRQEPHLMNNNHKLNKQARLGTEWPPGEAEAAQEARGKERGAAGMQITPAASNLILGRSAPIGPEAAGGARLADALEAQQEEEEEEARKKRRALGQQQRPPEKQLASSKSVGVQAAAARSVSEAPATKAALVDEQLTKTNASQATTGSGSGSNGSNIGDVRSRLSERVFWLALSATVLLPSITSAFLFTRAYFLMKEFKTRPYKPVPVARLATTPPALLTPRSPIPLIAQRQIYIFDAPSTSSSLAPRPKPTKPDTEQQEGPARPTTSSSSGSSNSSSSSNSEEEEDPGELLKRAANEMARRVSAQSGALNNGAAKLATSRRNTAATEQSNHARLEQAMSAPPQTAGANGQHLALTAAIGGARSPRGGIAWPLGHARSRPAQSYLLNGQQAASLYYNHQESQRPVCVELGGCNEGVSHSAPPSAGLGTPPVQLESNYPLSARDCAPASQPFQLPATGGLCKRNEQQRHSSPVFAYGRPVAAAEPEDEPASGCAHSAPTKRLATRRLHAQSFHYGQGPRLVAASGADLRKQLRHHHRPGAQAAVALQHQWRPSANCHTKVGAPSGSLGPGGQDEQQLAVTARRDQSCSAATSVAPSEQAGATPPPVSLALAKVIKSAAANWQPPADCCPIQEPGSNFQLSEGSACQAQNCSASINTERAEGQRRKQRPVPLCQIGAQARRGEIESSPATCELRPPSNQKKQQNSNTVILCTYNYMTDDQLLKSNILVFVVNFLLWLPFVALTIMLQLAPLGDSIGQTLSSLNVSGYNASRRDSLTMAQSSSHQTNGGGGGPQITPEFKNLVWWLATLNCCSCSYLYALTNKDFREAFNKLFYYLCCKSHVTFQKKTPIYRRQLDMDSRGNLRVHIIPGMNVCSNKLSSTLGPPENSTFLATTQPEPHNNHHSPLLAGPFIDNY